MLSMVKHWDLISFVIIKWCKILIYSEKIYKKKIYIVWRTKS